MIIITIIIVIIINNIIIGISKIAIVSIPISISKGLEEYGSNCL